MVNVPPGGGGPIDAHAQDLGTRVLSPKPRGWMLTHGLIAVNIAVFVVTFVFSTRTGNIDVPTLRRFGGLAPALVLAGDWWRLFTSSVLHAGLVHIAFNMYALYAFGRVAERVFGKLRFLIVYVGAGILASCGIVGLALVGLQSMNTLVVGASACIMGLVGALLYVAVAERRGWIRTGLLVSISALVRIIAFQAVFDMLVPQVSFAGHTLGWISGFALGWLVMRPWGPVVEAAGPQWR